MSAEEEMANLLATVAWDRGWTLVEQYVREGGIVLSFTPNTSIYGTASSRERTKAKVALKTDAAMRGYLRAVEDLREIEDGGPATTSDSR